MIRLRDPRVACDLEQFPFYSTFTDKITMAGQHLVRTHRKLFTQSPVDKDELSNLLTVGHLNSKTSWHSPAALLTEVNKSTGTVKTNRKGFIKQHTLGHFRDML